MTAETAKKIASLLVVLIATGLFISFYCFPSLDETDFSEAGTPASGVVSLRMVRNIPGSPTISFFGRHLALTTEGKHGAIEAYLFIPFIIIAGPTFLTLKIAMMFFGVLTIIATFILGERFFNFFTGAASALFLAVSPFFIDIVRLGDYGFSIPFFSVMATIFFFLYQDKGKKVYLCLWMSFLGLGFGAKGFFIWFILAFMAAAWLVYLRKNKINIAHIILGAFSFILTASPVLYYYLKTDIIGKFFLKKPIISSFGIGDGLLMQHILKRWEQGRAVIAGKVINFGGFHDITILLFGIVILVLIVRLILYRGTHPIKKRAVFLFLLTVFSITASAYTFTHLYPRHMNIIVPYPQLLMAVALWEIWRMCASKRFIGYGVIAALLALFLTSYVQKDIRECLERKKKMIDNAPCAVALLAEWLAENKFYNITALDAPGCSLAFLSNLTLNVKSAGGQKSSIFNSVAALKSGDIVVVGKPSRIKNNANVGYFYDAAKESNRQIEVLKEFKRADNKTVEYLVCSLK